MLFLDGRHRLAIARIAGVARVPGRVVFRHARMAEGRALIRALSRASDPQAPRHVADHPDLAHLPLDAAGLERARAALRAQGLPVPAFRPEPAP